MKPIYINARTGCRLNGAQISALRVGDRVDVVYPPENAGPLDSKQRTWRKVRFEMVQARDRHGAPYVAFSHVADRTLEQHEIAQYEQGVQR